MWRLSPFLCEFRGGVSFCEQVFWSRRGIGSPEEVVPEAPVIPESVANLGVQVLEQIPKQQIGPNCGLNPAKPSVLLEVPAISGKMM